MKALVLSGGTGTRLRPLTHSMPKQLMPVAGRPILLHCLDNIRAIGITEVGIVVGEHAEAIEAAVGDGSALGLDITYLRQEAPLGLAHCVLLARDFLGADDFVLYLGDNVLVPGIAEAAADFRRRRPAAQLMLAKVADPRAYGVAELESDGRIRALVEKPRQPRSDLAVIGVYFFTPAVHAAVRATTPSDRGELEITDAIGRLLHTGQRVVGAEYAGYWKDAGSPDDLLESNRVLLAAVRAEVRGTVDRATALHGPVVIEEGAVVTRSQLTGPVVIGAGSRVNGSTVGPHVTLGRECLLQDAGISDSIVLDGVSIQGVRGLSGSLIGRSATVRTAGPAHRRLIIGDHCRAEVAA
ncbi:glucose-1-phosphate thymidylyltransferase [Streptomyces thermoviolaceus]|uniref:Glucose-1-phosphate thymidylyltransferase n=1 Tax=Streptomyces thermoviolaceus subsp. thermoviolaceus TaxID=66860 RepID=A0ABX0YZ67_STRTL|nr:glucose-1-phosphate thymidylyltransferase [Streptomyces thermoviolaceus]NJP16365.1 glucose-1-phosphate thymidylyltransferase [Streptomyces thermoviolaceus subsp. thermoviolaceus]WTD48911.1 glucose-1-phosphate thymidylyltransferase [Streptomyces thermoviolaceus]